MNSREGKRLIAEGQDPKFLELTQTLTTTIMLAL